MLTYARTKKLVLFHRGAANTVFVDLWTLKLCINNEHRTSESRWTKLDNVFFPPKSAGEGARGDQMKNSSSSYILLPYRVEKD